MAESKIIQFHIKSAKQVAARLMKISEGDMPMVVAKRGKVDGSQGFQIGYDNTAWAHHVKKLPSYVGTFDHTTELEQLSRELMGGN